MEMQIAQFLKDNPKKAFSSREIAKAVDMPQDTVESVLDKLLREHRVASRKTKVGISYYVYVFTTFSHLRTEKDMEAFSYECPVGFSGYDVEKCKRCPSRVEEFDVKRALMLSLSEKGWIVEQIAWGHEPGADLIFRHEKLGNLVIEAKGEGSRYQMRRNYFSMVLGDLLQRMDDPNKKYGVGLPAYKQFTAMAVNTPEWIKTQLNLSLFFVKKLKERYGYSIGHMSSGVSWEL
jgi:hypothetical protein